MSNEQDIVRLSADVAVLRSTSENQQKEIDEIKKAMANYVPYAEFNSFKAAVFAELDDGEKLLKRVMASHDRLKEMFKSEQKKEEGKKELIQQQEEASQKRWKRIIRWFVISSSVATCIGAIGGITLFEKIKSWIGF
jgi:hypothetical protein